jgi:hypothetical protein
MQNVTKFFRKYYEFRICRAHFLLPQKTGLSRAPLSLRPRLRRGCSAPFLSLALLKIRIPADFQLGVFALRKPQGNGSSRHPCRPSPPFSASRSFCTAKLRKPKRRSLFCSASPRTFSLGFLRCENPGKWFQPASLPAILAVFFLAEFLHGKNSENQKGAAFLVPHPKGREAEAKAAPF